MFDHVLLLGRGGRTVYMGRPPRFWPTSAMYSVRGKRELEVEEQSPRKEDLTVFVFSSSVPRGWRESCRASESRRLLPRSDGEVTAHVVTRDSARER